MNTTKNDQQQRLHTFFSGDKFTTYKQHLPLMLRPGDQAGWLLTTDEAEAILHQYAPDLSATVSGTTMVIFKEQTTAN